MKTILTITLSLLLLVAVGCATAPGPQHVVVPGPGGQARVMHLEQTWMAKPHGCDSHSHLDWDQVPSPGGLPPAGGATMR